MAQTEVDQRGSVTSRAWEPTSYKVLLQSQQASVISKQAMFKRNEN